MGSYKWVISRATILLTNIRGLVALLISTHEPPSRAGISENIHVPLIVVTSFQLLNKNLAAHDPVVDPARHLRDAELEHVCPEDVVVVAQTHHLDFEITRAKK